MRFFKFWVGLAMVGALVLGITLGSFVIGDAIVAGGGQPGSQQDPLVSQSYITQAVQERTDALELQITELEKQVASLVNTVEMLETQVGRAGGQSNQTQQTGQGASATQTGNNAGNTVEREMVVTVANNTGVNVRSGPSTSFEVVTSLANGARVNVVAESSGWYEINLDNNRTGWVRSDFLR